MFGNKSNGGKAARNNSAITTGINIIGEGTVIEGDIKSEGDIRIDGAIKGFVTSRARLVVGPKGKVDGDISCLQADISGLVTGSLEVGDMLFLKSTSVVEGDLSTGKLVVESGARFNGTCRMGSQERRRDEEKETPKLKKQVV